MWDCKMRDGMEKFCFCSTHPVLPSLPSPRSTAAPSVPYAIINKNKLTLPFRTPQASRCVHCPELRLSTEPSVLDTFPEHNGQGSLILFQPYCFALQDV